MGSQGEFASKWRIPFAILLSTGILLLYLTFTRAAPSSSLLEQWSSSLTSTGKAQAMHPLIEGADRRLGDARLARLLAAHFQKSAAEDHPREITVPALQRLADCLEEDSCGSGEQTVILLASWHFGEAWKGHTSGEDIWAKSTIKSFQALNHTLLYTSTVADTYLIYKHLSHMIPVILWEANQMERCMMGHRGWTDGIEARGCMQTASNPEGIPIWKSFAFHFWEDNKSPLGRDWTVAPEDYATMGLAKGGPNQYLGYSIEERCKKIPVPEVKDHRAILLGKRLSYFEPPEMAFPGIGSIVPQIAPEVSYENGEVTSRNFTLVTTASVRWDEQFPEPGVEIVRDLAQMGWTQEVAGSKAMIGVGWPYLSPSPYDALCLGIPFINPIRSWDTEDPENRSKWITQHSALKKFDPPYVYHVQRNDLEGLKKAVQGAIANPIKSFIPPAMNFDAVKERHRLLIETNWQERAEKVVAEKWPQGDFPFLISL